METFGKLKAGEIVERRQVGVVYRRPALVINGANLTMPNTAQNFIDAGWLLRVVPSITDEQRLGDLIINADNYTFEVIDKTAEEIDIEEKENKAMALSVEMYQVLKWFKAEGIITTTNIANAPQALKDAYITRQALGQ